MISRDRAEQLATEWARRETQRLGYRCTPIVDEFDVGYLIRPQPQPSAEPSAAAGHPATVIIDKETGDLSRWPGLPPTVVRDMYRADRAGHAGKPRTVDPAVESRRTSSRVLTPGVTAQLTVQHDQHVARGAKGDLELRHHPLVQAFLDSLPPGIWYAVETGTPNWSSSPKCSTSTTVGSPSPAARR